MRDELQIIDDFIAKLGGLSAAARRLSTPKQPLKAQHLHNWRTRGRVAPEMRAHFRKVFNEVMGPRHYRLGLEWLASPATQQGRGKANGTASRRKKKRRTRTQGQRAQRSSEARP